MTLFHHLFDLDVRETRGHRLFFRLFEAFIAAYTIHFAWTWGYYIQYIDSVVLPLGIANYVDVSFLFSHNLSLVNAAVITALVTAGLLMRVRWAYLAALLLFHLQYTARYCLGEISHGSNMVGFSLMALGLAFLLFRDNDERRRFTFGFIWFFVGIAYTSAAACKLIGTGLTWMDGHHLWLWIQERGVDVLAGRGTFALNTLQNLLVEYWWLATATLAFGWLAEAGGILLWWKSTRPYIATAMIGMHLGIWGSMNLFFGEYIFELILIGYPWPRLINEMLVYLESKWPNFTRLPGMHAKN